MCTEGRALNRCNEGPAMNVLVGGGVCGLVRLCHVGTRQHEVCCGSFSGTVSQVVWLAVRSNVAYVHAAVGDLACCWVLLAFVPGRCVSWHAYVVGCQYSIPGWAGEVLGSLLCGCAWDLQQQVGLLQRCVGVLSLESDFTPGALCCWPSGQRWVPPACCTLCSKAGGVVTHAQRSGALTVNT